MFYGVGVRKGKHRGGRRLTPSPSEATQIDLGRHAATSSTDLDCFDLLDELLVNLKGLLEECELDGLLGHRRTIEVVQAIDEVLDLATVGLDGSEDEKVLQVGVVAAESNRGKNYRGAVL